MMGNIIKRAGWETLRLGAVHQDLLGRTRTK